MIVELRGGPVSYDRSTRTARIEVVGLEGCDGAPADTGVTTEEPGIVLFGLGGVIVGVDVATGSARRAVVMLGTHESVTSTQETALDVSRDAQGRLTSVVIRGVTAPP